MSQHDITLEDGSQLKVTVVEATPRRRPSRYDDPELYERVTIGGTPCTMPTHKRAEQLRALVKEHMKPLEPRYGWKGEVEAVVPNEIVDDMREAMGFIGAIVDHEEPRGAKTRLYSQGYHVHIGM